MFELLDGKGTEFGALSLFIFFLMFLNKMGVFKKVKVWIKIGGNGNGLFGTVKKVKTTNNPVDVPKLKADFDNLKDAVEKSEERNREDHKELFQKIEEIRVKIGV